MSIDFHRLKLVLSGHTLFLGYGSVALTNVVSEVDLILKKLTSVIGFSLPYISLRYIDFLPLKSTHFSVRVS